MKRNHTKKYPLLMTVLLFVFLLNSVSFLLATGSQPKNKWEVELYSGFALVQPKDFNRIAQTDAEVQHFMYDVYYNYLVNIGDIQRWNKTQDKNYGEIKNGLTCGIRLKYNLTSSLSLSLGVKSLWAQKNSDPSFVYEQVYDQSYRYSDQTYFSQYSLSASGWAPLVGFHWGPQLSEKLKISAFVAGGPLFGHIQHKREWNSSWSEVTSNYTDILYENSGEMNLKGKGTGVALEGGVNVQFQLGHSFGLFFEGLYAYQKVSALSGIGHSRSGNETNNWEGDWAIKHGVVESNFIGSISFDYPSNSWLSWENPVKDFFLNLSGFECRIGLSYKF